MLFDVLMVRAIKGRDEKAGVDASFWRREQSGEDGILVLEVMIQNEDCATRRIVGHRHGVRACNARIGHFENEEHSSGTRAVKCGEESVVREENFDCSWVEIP